MSKVWMDEDKSGDFLDVSNRFYSGYLSLEISSTIDMVDLSVNQVKDLMSHLQRALDEHGDKT